MERAYQVLVWLIVWLIVFPTVLIVLRFVPSIAPPWPGPEAASFLTAIAEVLRAIQWPLVALIIAVFFRTDIRRLLEGLQRGKLKFLGTEWELETRLAQSEEASSTLLVTSELHAQPPNGVDVQPQPTPAVEQLPLETIEEQERSPEEVLRRWLEANPDRISEAIRLARERPETTPADTDHHPLQKAQDQIIRAATWSPRIALGLVSSQLRKALNAIARLYGHDSLADKPMSPEKKATELEARQVLSPLAADAIRKFWAVQSLLHGKPNEANDERLRAVDSGLAILASLRATYDLPREFFVDKADDIVSEVTG
jgi:hypothetical protein